MPESSHQCLVIVWNRRGMWTQFPCSVDNPTNWKISSLISHPLLSLLFCDFSPDLSPLERRKRISRWCTRWTELFESKMTTSRFRTRRKLIFSVKVYPIVYLEYLNSVQFNLFLLLPAEKFFPEQWRPCLAICSSGNFT